MKMKVTEVEEVNYGVYVWQMPNDSLVADDENNYLCIYAIKGDVAKIKALRDAVKHYGIEEGAPLWLSGHRKVTDEEYQYQKQRLDLGLVADEWDMPALKEDLINKKKMGII